MSNNRTIHKVSHGMMEVSSFFSAMAGGRRAGGDGRNDGPEAVASWWRRAQRRAGGRGELVASW
jgi:hypothetical protein